MTKRKKIIVLGATGSIGTSCLDIVRHNRDLFEIVGASAHNDANALALLVKEFDIPISVVSAVQGEKALLDMIRASDAEIAVNGIAGSSGLMPSIAALESGKNLALANKETIVMAGPLIRALADTNGKKIIPVDSEHSAVFSLINAFGTDNISEVILTASGGPFRTWDAARLAEAKPSDALRHPTWSMGGKITIDSASLANKGLEVIEACRLFDMKPSRVKVVVHPQSLVHSFVRTLDGALYAQISKPDMRHPIFSALTWPCHGRNHLDNLTFEELCTMHFEPPRFKDFPLLDLAYGAADREGSYTIAYNASNEMAVAAFIEGRLSFPGLAEVTGSVLDLDWSHEPSSFAEIFEADRKARECARSFITGNKT
jgi:1-deoxy-D-xylulose-5-phosphate reductoisomerase